MQGSQQTYSVIEGEVNTSCVDMNIVSCTSVWAVQFSAQKSLAVVETNVEFDSYAATCVVGDQFLVIHDYNRLVNIYGYNPKTESKHFCIVDNLQVPLEIKEWILQQ